MNEKLEKILKSIDISPSDSLCFGKVALGIVKNTPELHDPNNNFEFLRNFLSDTINFLKHEIEYTKKYNSQVFHPNVSISREFKLEIYLKILDELKNNM